MRSRKTTAPRLLDELQEVAAQREQIKRLKDGDEVMALYLSGIPAWRSQAEFVARIKVVEGEDGYWRVLDGKSVVLKWSDKDALGLGEWLRDSFLPPAQVFARAVAESVARAKQLGQNNAGRGHSKDIEAALRENPKRTNSQLAKEHKCTASNVGKIRARIFGRFS